MVGREEDLAVGSRSCSVELPIAAQLRGDVDELEAVVGRIEDAHTISVPGREDDLAIGSRSCASELTIATQLHGNVAEL